MRKSRRNILIAATTALLLVGGGAAYAYWTLSGSGTGTASTGTVTGTITAVQTTTVSNLRPGGTAQSLAGNFTNTDTSPIYVTSVTASISSVTKAVGAVAGTCDATDYTLSNATMTVNASVPTGTAQGSWTGATIAFNNKATNQDQCQGATVNIAYSIQ
jgi:hypothetical protein